MSKLFKSKFFLGVAIVAVFAFVGANLASAQTSTVTASAYTYSGVMKVGMKGPGISTLQAALNSVQTLQVVVDGSFGPATRAAVMQFQASHGLVADGVVGPMTGAALTAATVAVITVPTGGLPAGCTSTSGFSTTTGQACNSGSSLPAGCTSTSGFSPTTGKSCSGGSSSGSLSGGETDVNSVSIDDADDDTITEGSSEAAVADIQFDVDDADAELVRADIVFQIANSETGEDKPWNAFDKVLLMDGNDVIASMDASDSDNWDDAPDITGGETDSDAQRIRFNNINQVYDEGSNNNDLWVAVDVANSVDGADSDNDWLVEVDAEGLRFTDGAGIDTFVDTDTAAESASFTIETSGGNSDLTLTQDSSSPDAANLEVDESSSTTATIAVFKVKADEDGGDVKFDDFPVTLTLGPSSATTFDQVVDDVMIEVDGNEYSTDDAVQTTAISADATQVFHFSDIEDDDVAVNAGDNMTVTVKVKFHSQGSSFSNYANGVTVLATSAADDSDFEDADTGDDIATQTLATPSGETQTLYSTGISISNFDGSDFDTISDNGLVTSQTYHVSFDVTAFGDTFYIPKIVEQGTDGTDLSNDDTSGLAYLAETSAGTPVTPGGGEDVGAVESSLTSPDADTVGVYFEVPEGETITLQVTIELNNTGDTAGFYHVQLSELLYDLDTTAVGANEAIYAFAPTQDYETDDAKVD